MAHRVDTHNPKHVHGWREFLREILIIVIGVAIALAAGEAVDDWNWTEGLEPAQDAPVWKMSAFRDRFLTAYGSVPHPTTG